MSCIRDGRLVSEHKVGGRNRRMIGALPGWQAACPHGTEPR